MSKENHYNIGMKPAYRRQK